VRAHTHTKREKERGEGERELKKDRDSESTPEDDIFEKNISDKSCRILKDLFIDLISFISRARGSPRSDEGHIDFLKWKFFFCIFLQLISKIFQNTETPFG